MNAPRVSVSRLWPALGGAAGGGALAAVAMLTLWGVPAPKSEVGQQAARIETLEGMVRELAGREPPRTVDPKTIDSVADRVARLEAAGNVPRAAAADPALAGRVADVEKGIGALAEEIAVLRRRGDSTAATAEAARRHADAATARAETAQATGAQRPVIDRQDIAALSDRLTALEGAAQAVQADVARQQQSALTSRRDTRADGRAVRLAVVAEMLKAAVARGDRFRTELDAAKALAPDTAALVSLEAFADTGIPTAGALAQQLRAVLPVMRRMAAPKASADGSFLKRLQVNAERLVRVQPIGEQPGDDADAILARAEVRTDGNDIGGILAELTKLPPEVRAPAENWIKTAQARNAAIDASRSFAAAHVGALSGRSD
ncbi:MAG: hypothetical protein GEU91_11795 [Rhizobiales bacterium]|nr:hypothetical protein [Hyphomicrobiales bacterium]